jgi:uncharacterized lipoprotein YmbA
MTMTAMKWTLCLLLAGLMTACGSTPRSDYYMLSANAKGSVGSEGPSIGIGPVTVPEYLKRREMVLNRSANRLDLADFDRWAEPLDAGILRVTALNLSLLLKTQQVQTFPWRRSNLPDFGISIAVVQFSMKGNQALLVAQWTVTEPATGDAVAQHISHLEASARGSEPEDVAAVYSDLLRELSEAIAAAITKQQAS